MRSSIPQARDLCCPRRAGATQSNGLIGKSIILIKDRRNGKEQPPTRTLGFAVYNSAGTKFTEELHVASHPREVQRSLSKAGIRQPLDPHARRPSASHPGL